MGVYVINEQGIHEMSISELEARITLERAKGETKIANMLEGYLQKKQRTNTEESYNRAMKGI